MSGADDARPTVHFYGWRIVDGHKLARRAVRPASADERLLQQAGWRFQAKLAGGYDLWAPPVDQPVRIERVPSGQVIVLGEPAVELVLFGHVP